MDYEISYDVSKFLDASIEKVIHTLVEAFILVGLVVFLFLGDWRSTLIPAIAVPVSLIGTFVFMQFFGITLNLITLFALVLAIGIVVDNAIVVIEAVHAKMETKNLSPSAGHRRSDARDQWGHHRHHICNGCGIYTRCIHVGAGRYILPAVLHHDGHFHRFSGLGGANAYTGTLRHDAEKHAWSRERKHRYTGLLDGFNNWFNRITGRYQEITHSNRKYAG